MCACNLTVTKLPTILISLFLKGEKKETLAAFSKNDSIITKTVLPGIDYSTGNE